MLTEKDLNNLVKKFLPPSAEILKLKNNSDKDIIYVTDLDGDKIPEIIVGYKYQGDAYIMILKNSGGAWGIAQNIKGPGYNISYLRAVSLTKGRPSLIIGWQVGSIWSKLSILEQGKHGLKEVLNKEGYFSKIEVEDMLGKNGRDGIEEIALWKHDTGEAYIVEVYRLVNGELVIAKDVYPYYFKKVASYYGKLVEKHPDYSFYWYYLALAEFNAGRKEQALKAVEKALEFENPYPSKVHLLKLEEAIKGEFRKSSLFPASINTVKGVFWGYIDKTGKMVIKPQFQEAREFQDNGLAVTRKGKYYGLINEQGIFVIEPRYESINEFSEGRAVVIDNSGFKVIDEKGKEITNKAYDFINSYKNSRALFSSSDGKGKYLYGYLDLNGGEIISSKYQEATDFSKDGKATVKVKDKEFNLINTNGQILNKYNYPFVGAFSEGTMPFQKEAEGKFGFIDEKGNEIISPQYSSAGPFEEGRAVVNTFQGVMNNYGLIDNKGNYIIKPEYNYIFLLGEGRYAIGKAIDDKKPYLGSKYAIADANGNILTDFIYYEVNSFEKGLASVYDEKNTYFIDRSGKKVANLPIVQGNGRLKMMDDIIQLNMDFRTSYLDREGNIIWQQNTLIPINDQYSIKEIKYKPNRDYLVYYPEVKGMKDNTAQAKLNEELKKLSKVQKIDSNVKLDYNYFGDFAVAFFKKQLLELRLDGYQYYFGAAHGMPSKIYAPSDLVSGRIYALKDLFKKNSDYVKRLSDIIGEQIKNNKKYSYVFPDSYKGIKPDQPFYVKEDALFIYFYPYEIAPYAAGFPTFKIYYDEIKDIIDTKGEFWKSFN